MNMKDTEARSAAPRALSVQRGLVLPPGVLRAVLPDVASVVTNAMSSSPKEKIFGLRKHKGATSAGHSKRAARSAPTEPQAQTTGAGKEPRHSRSILNPFPCNICKQWFPSRQALNVHWLRHNKQCDYCKLGFVSRDLGQKHKCCKFCEKLYKSKADYNNHMKEQHGRLYPVFQKNRRLQCSICKQCFSKKNDLMKHVYEMSFTCKECKMCYRSPEEHIDHSKPEFSCHHCGKYFEESLSFTSHMRTHTGPVKSYSRAPKKPKLTNTATQTRPDTSDVKCSEEVETSKRKTEITVNVIDRRPGEVVNEKYDFKEEPSELNDDIKSSDVTEFYEIKVEPPELVSREAETSLYSGHQIQGGMVFEPVRVLPPDVYTIRNGLLNKSNSCKQEPASDNLLCTSPTAEPGSVKVEPALPFEEVYIVDSKSWFPSIKTEDIV